jgi:integrase
VTVYFNKARDRWMFEFWQRRQRHRGYCLDAAGAPVTSKNAALQAEGVAKRAASMSRKTVDPHTVTIGQVVAVLQVRWKTEATWSDKKRQAREIVKFFGASRSMREIDADRIRAYTDFAMAQPIKIWTAGPGADEEAPASAWKSSGRIRSAATVNRYLSLLRQIIGRAAEMRDGAGRLVLEDPPAVKDLPELKRRARPVPEPVLEIALDMLPPHARDALVLTLYFGFRKSEVFQLQIHQVDFVANGIWLAAEDVKDREDAFLPGAPPAMAFLRRLVDQAQARGATRLITYRRHPDAKAPGKWKPVAGSRTAWKRVMDHIQAQTGRRYRWHDVRAAFITHVALTSGPVAAQRMARHSDYETTQAYVEVADKIRRGAATDAAARPALRLVNGTKVPNTSPQRKSRSRANKS